MDFAKRQLTKQGWTDGSGLGKEESGIKEPVKVKIKNDNKGVGHDSGAEFTFHWWDHLFNKAASNIDVQHTEAGVEIKNSTTTARSKQKTKAYDNKAMLYGQFVKGSTLSGGTETMEQQSPEEDLEEPVIKHALLPDNEEEVFKQCGGRTAHKGARHGLKLNGKLQRIEQQEQLLLDKLTKKSTNQGHGQSSATDLNQSESTTTTDFNENSTEAPIRSKKRKKKNKSAKKESRNDCIQDLSENKDELDCDTELNDDQGKSERKKKKKKRKGNTSDETVDLNGLEGKGTDETEVAVVNDNTVEELENTNSEVKIKKKKKKKRKLNTDE